MTRIERFRDAYWTWFLKPKTKRGVAGRQALSSLFRHAWRHGTVSDQCLVLDFLSRACLPRAADIIQDGLRARRTAVRGNALVAALLWARQDGLSRPLIDQLKRIALRSRHESQRYLALEALTEAGAVDAAWLIRVARQDTSADVRRQAYAQLLPAGSKEAKRALLTDVRRHPDSFGVADDIWLHRSAVGLTEREETFLRGVLHRYVEWLQYRLRDPDEDQDRRRIATDVLARFAGDGFGVRQRTARSDRQAAPRASA